MEVFHFLVPSAGLVLVGSQAGVSIAMEFLHAVTAGLRTRLDA